MAAVALLTFSKDRKRALEVDKEFAVLKTMFNETKFQPEVELEITSDNLRRLALKHRDQLRVFHFAGHADSEGLQIHDDDDDFTPKFNFATGIADTFGNTAKNIKLAFLNGCSTAAQAQAFLDAGVAAVITTSLPVRDSVAILFAKTFYLSFLKYEKTTLGEAFRQGLAELKTKFKSSKVLDKSGNISENWLDESLRGNYKHRKKEDFAVADELYKIHFRQGQEQVENETLADWSDATAEPNRQKTTDNLQQTATFGIQADRYLLCNRSQHYLPMEQVLQRKKANELPLPYFFFIHDQEENCPEDLCERFLKIGLPTLCPSATKREDIILEEEDLFRTSIPWDANDPNRDLFKTRLSEIYKQHFEGEPAENNHLCKLIRRPSDYEALAVVHPLSVKHWNPRNATPERQTERRKKIKTLLEYYLNEFSDYLRDGFSKRLIVIFYVKYFGGADDFFPTLFTDLEHEFGADRVGVLGKLPRITDVHIDDWQDLVFKRRFLIGKYFQDSDDLSFYETKNVLDELIADFNQKLRNKTAATNNV